jgi:hypothetical protein
VSLCYLAAILERDERPKRQAGFNSRQFRETDPIGTRPDRLAFWAVVLAVVAMLVAAGTGTARADAPAHAEPIVLETTR